MYVLATNVSEPLECVLGSFRVRLWFWLAARRKEDFCLSCIRTAAMLTVCAI